MSDRRTRQKIRKTFRGQGALAAARSWRAEASRGVSRGELQPATRQTVREAADEWLEAAERGEIRNRSGEAFKPSALRSYRASLTIHVLPEVGQRRFSELRRLELQDLADRLLAAGLDPSTVRNALMPLRSIYRRAVARGTVAVNPTAGLELPAPKGRRDKIASPAEASKLIEALPVGDRPLWAAAFYSGLRLGELLALQWGDVDLQAGLIHVERSYDPKSHEYVAPKSRAGTRRVPILAPLRLLLLEHKAGCAWSGRGDGLVFGRAADRTFNYQGRLDAAKRAWTKAELDGCGLHEARHTCASLLIASGANLKAVSSIMGHASIAITIDRYGHLTTGAEQEVGKLADAYLAR